MALGAIFGLRGNNIIDKIYNLCKDKYFEKKEQEELKVARNIIFFIDIIKSPNFSFSDNFENPKGMLNVNKNIGWYEHSFKLTLYYLINFEILDEKNKFKNILHEMLI